MCMGYFSCLPRLSSRGQGAMHLERLSLYVTCMFFKPQIPGVPREECCRGRMCNAGRCAVYSPGRMKATRTWHTKRKSPLLSLNPAVYRLFLPVTQLVLCNRVLRWNSHWLVFRRENAAVMTTFVTGYFDNTWNIGSKYSSLVKIPPRLQLSAAAGPPRPAVLLWHCHLIAQ